MEVIKINLSSTRTSKIPMKLNLVAVQSRKEEEKLKESAEKEDSIKKAEGQYENAKRQHDTASQALKQARRDLEKRIYEYDICVRECKPEELVNATLRSVHGFEETVEKAKERFKVACEHLDMTKLSLREIQSDAQGLQEGTLPGIVVKLKVRIHTILYLMGFPYKLVWDLCHTWSGSRRSSVLSLRCLSSEEFHTVQILPLKIDGKISQTLCFCSKNSTACKPIFGEISTYYNICQLFVSALLSTYLFFCNLLNDFGLGQLLKPAPIFVGQLFLLVKIISRKKCEFSTAFTIMFSPPYGATIIMKRQRLYFHNDNQRFSIMLCILHLTCCL